MIVKSKRKRLIAVLAVALLMVVSIGLVAAGCGEEEETTTTAAAATTTTAAETTTSEAATTTEAPATTEAPLEANLNGAGATFPEPLYVEWIGAFQGIEPGVTINYQGVGSGAGIEQFTAQTVDFGASDAFMKDEELAAAEAARAGAKVLHIPTVFGAITLAYNLPGVESLKLDSDTIVKIFLGQITKWDDAALKALNPDVTLPSSAIETVHRSDSSGTTNGFTSYLAAVNEEWAAGPGKGKEIQWPVGVAAKGNDGVANLIKQTEASIGYIELTYAVSMSMPVAELKNKAGNFVAPTLESTSAAADISDIPADMNLVVSDSDNPEAYPIVSPTFLLAYDKNPDAAKAAAFKAWVLWSLGDEGTAIATELGYAPLPSGLKDAVLQLIDSIE